MKTLLIASLVTLFSVSANAQIFLRAQCNFNQFQGECSVVNHTNMTLQCHLEAQGRTYSGFYANAFVNAFLYPGQNAWVYVNSNNGYVDPLVFVSGSANCQSVY